MSVVNLWKCLFVFFIIEVITEIIIVGITILSKIDRCIFVLYMCVLYICVYVCICICIYIYICVCLCVYAYMYAYVYKDFSLQILILELYTANSTVTSTTFGEVGIVSLGRLPT